MADVNPTLRTRLTSMGRDLVDSIFRHGRPVTDRSRSQAVFTNLFLHLHPTRTHVRTLRPSTTLGLGTISFSLFVVLAVTGVLLMLYFKPSVELAYGSVKDIHYVVPLGRIMRNVHRWAAHLMVAAVFLHMFRVFYTAAYTRPREFNWLVGLALLVLTLALSFTGYLLPWDQLAYWAITIGANIAGSPSELTDALGITRWFDPGGLQKEILLGSRSVGGEALIRFYTLHVIVLPLVLSALIGVHFWRIRKDGGLARPGGTPTHAGKGAGSEGTPASTPDESPTKTYGLMCVVRDRRPATNLDPADTVPSWPYLLRAEVLIFLATFVVCLALGLMLDAPLKELANPAIPENPAKAPWYFLGLQEIVSYSAFIGGLVMPAVTVLGLALVPYIDRDTRGVGTYFTSKQGRRWSLITLGVATVLAVLAVAIPVNFGWIRNWFPDASQLIVIAVNPGSLLMLAYAGWSLLVLRLTRSKRMAALALFTCFVVGFVILTYVGMELRGPNWDFFWSKADWPVH